eukprot:11171643-Lingulodinium_polyedra.AAC.1
MSAHPDIASTPSIPLPSSGRLKSPIAKLGASPNTRNQTTAVVTRLAVSCATRGPSYQSGVRA